MKSTSVIARFWSKVDRSGGPSACWLWTQYRDRDGYGQFWISKGVPVRANRFSFESANAIKLGELRALHSCDTPACCNPAHLFAGTNGDNTRDMMAKGRQANQNMDKSHCDRGHAFDGANTYLDTAGARQCKACRRARYHAGGAVALRAAQTTEASR